MAEMLTGTSDNMMDHVSSIDHHHHELQQQEQQQQHEQEQHLQQDSLHHHQQQQRPFNIILSPEEFAEDLELRLGRANGNIYYRKAGVEGIHDGQVMVRLKKKRFVILDYSIIPTEEELQLAAINPHIACPEGAGKRQCVTPGCLKVGVPVLLYDSDPAEPTSLYLRSGLCFTCQRNLNEKRRTQRKRKSDVLIQEPSGAGPGAGGVADDGRGGTATGGVAHDTTNTMVTSHHHHRNSLASSHHTSAVVTIASDQKKLKLNGNIIHLAPDAIIINGPVNGAKHHNSDGYSFHEIGIDLSHVVQQAVHETHCLLHAVSPTTATTNNKNNNNTIVATSTTASSASHPHASSMAMSSLDASAMLTSLSDDGLHHSLDHGLQQNHHHHQHNPLLLHPSTSATNNHLLSSEDIAAMYDKAFLSLSKSLFLLSQWKSAWDTEVAVAVAQEESVHDACLCADAIASAAAVVAAAAASTTAATTAMGVVERQQQLSQQQQQHMSTTPSPLLPPTTTTTTSLDAGNNHILNNNNCNNNGSLEDLLLVSQNSNNTHHHQGGDDLHHHSSLTSCSSTNMVSLLLAAEQKGDDMLLDHGTSNNMFNNNNSNRPLSTTTSPKIPVHAGNMDDEEEDVEVDVDVVNDALDAVMGHDPHQHQPESHDPQGHSPYLQHAPASASTPGDGNNSQNHHHVSPDDVETFAV